MPAKQSTKMLPPPKLHAHKNKVKRFIYWSITTEYESSSGGVYTPNVTLLEETDFPYSS
jgi:hypothetical protein